VLISFFRMAIRNQTMSLTDIKARIAVVMQGVSGIGNVYSHTRLVNVESVQASDFVANGVLNTWWIVRSTAELEEVGDIDHISSQWDLISIHGFYAVKDSADSEDSFDLLADAVLAAVHADSNYPSRFAGTIKQARAPKIKVLDYRHFGVSKVLCHHTEITIQVVSRIMN
jgi:hypothetical protein